jgi:hypothetical protein
MQRNINIKKFLLKGITESMRGKVMTTSNSVEQKNEASLPSYISRVIEIL